ncbi:glutathione peroxidase homolog BsaA-like [Brassica napus]|uniref:glutathione peroxidase homolog BsaA-like n=1 Tax=Brassica napus TaxID=3708 RepID=UPI002078B549|nr:glutathione peroxidase homolog BsaA-like [Brassica napus]
MHSYKFVALYVWNGAELWLSFWSEVHYNSLYDIQGLSCVYEVKQNGGFVLEDTDYDLLSECSGSSSAEAKEKTLAVLESKPLTWTTSSYYFLSIVHKSTIRVSGQNAAPLFKFLKASKLTFLGSRNKWNFTKFLVSKDGIVIDRYGTMVTPLSIEKDIKKALEEA